MSSDFLIKSSKVKVIVNGDGVSVTDRAVICLYVDVLDGLSIWVVVTHPVKSRTGDSESFRERITESVYKRIYIAVIS